MLSKRISTIEAVWGGVRVRRVQRPAADVWLPAIGEHYLCINAGTPHRLAYECEGRSYDGVRGTGDMVLTPAARPSRWRKEEAGEGLHLFVAPALLSRMADDLGRGAGYLGSAFCVRDPQVEHIGYALLEEAGQGCPNGLMYGEALGTALAAHLMRRYGTFGERSVDQGAPQGLSPLRLRRVLDFMQDNLDRDVTLAQAAEIAGISPYHFARLFRLSMGCSPHQHLIARRVDRAKEMLVTGRVSVGETAAAVGFADQSHLARHFKRIVGVTPSRFLRDS
ncbi:MAG: AraC family transcriptional regulator [Capsulimonas sp.]|nr:AraC family transcriptional regulator [Capsulimonas sp.]